VVGAGLAGLVAAFELTGGVDGPGPSTPRVTILEATDRVGGALQTTTLQGACLDLGADGFLATRPEGVALVRDLGHADQLLPVGASGASIYLDGRVAALPKGLVLGVPTSPRLVRHLALSARARRGLWRDWWWPHRLDLDEDPTLGAILRGKFNDAVVDELIEPMIGGIQAGRVDDLSAEEIFPALVAAARRGGSLQRALRPPTPTAPSGPVFYSLRDGLGSLPHLLLATLQHRGVHVQLHTTVTAIRSTPAGQRRLEVDTASETYGADAVVVATAGSVAGRLVGPSTPEAVELTTMRYAGAVMVTFALALDEQVLPPGTGVLVPLQTPSAQHPDTLLATAITFLDRKWHRDQPAETVFLRVHAGRIDDQRAHALTDEQLTARLYDDLTQVIGPLPPALATVVQRWPMALPQYEPGHAGRVARVRSALQPRRIALTGLTYDGVGVPATIGASRRVGREVLDWLARP
jgi:protoporphyrinogen/coproporphyrinogen III oxidase